MAIQKTPETAPGEYGDLFEFLMKELKLFQRKLLVILKHVKTGESQVCLLYTSPSPRDS